MNTPENPPAFPHRAVDGNVELGMSLRDYFAAAALQGLLAADVQQQHSAMRMADWSYQQADAMLAERQ